MKALKRKGFVAGLVLMAFILVNLFVILDAAQAAAAPKEYVQLNASIPLADNLIALKGEDGSGLPLVGPDRHGCREGGAEQPPSS